MTRSPVCLLVLALLALPATVRPASAAWPHDPYNGNVGVCTAAGVQASPTIVADGAGGVIVTWQDNRTGLGRDIYAQRISASGVPLWTEDGVGLCTAAGEQYSPTVTSDGAGGAIVTWYDDRGGNSDIYAQRISAEGSAQWAANGVAACVAAGTQAYPTITPDAAGGAIIVWYDNRSGAGFDIYTQHLSAAGDPQWTANGVALCTAAQDQVVPMIVPDGSGGAIVTWYDNRTGTNYDVYAQRISAAGGPQWPTNGVAIASGTGDQYSPMIAADGSGGAIITWYDYRSALTYDIYAQRVNAAGAALWTANGLAVCTATNQQYSPVVASDGSGGAIISWQDLRATSSFDIYAQRINAAGTAMWAANGVGVCTAATDQFYPMIVSDLSGGAIITWQDNRPTPSYDTYAQRINAAGSPLWTANGVALSAALGNQAGPVITGDGAGGAIVAWYDARGGANHDIYAQKIERFGNLGSPEAAITGVVDVRNDQGGSVKVAWSASYLDADPTYGITEYRVFRSVPAPFAAAAALRLGVTSESDEAARDGRLLVLPSAASATSWEFMGSQAAEAVASYSMVVATPADSVADSNPPTWFMLEARASASISSPRWFSAPDSGYSVDNLAPAAPAPFTGQYAAGTTSLHWHRNTESDLAGYRLYRGIGAAFVPGPGNLLGALPDTGYVDVAGSPYVYKLTAVDAHGNESLVSTLVLAGTLDVDGASQQALSFAAPNPNPARGETTLRYALSRAGHVRLAVYDAAGRRVQLLRDGELSAGAHEQSFALRDASGRQLASGLYLVRLEAEGRVLTRRLASIR